LEKKATTEDDDFQFWVVDALVCGKQKSKLAK
jgi:hypothetical protein